jgi:hypothetical protein
VFFSRTLSCKQVSCQHCVARRFFLFVWFWKTGVRSTLLRGQVRRCAFDLCAYGFVFCIFRLSAATGPLCFLCVTVGPAHPLRVVATSVMPSKKTKTSEVTGISTTDYQYVPEEFGDHHGKHDVWVAEIPFIGLKTFTCDTSGYLCCCKSR